MLILVYLRRGRGWFREVIAANIWPEIPHPTAGYDTDRAANLVRAILGIGVDAMNEMRSRLMWQDLTGCGSAAAKVLPLSLGGGRRVECVGELVGNEMRTRFC